MEFTPHRLKHETVSDLKRKRKPLRFWPGHETSRESRTVPSITTIHRGSRLDSTFAFVSDFATLSPARHSCRFSACGTPNHDHDCRLTVGGPLGRGPTTARLPPVAWRARRSSTSIKINKSFRVRPVRSLALDHFCQYPLQGDTGQIQFQRVSKSLLGPVSSWIIKVGQIWSQIEGKQKKIKCLVNYSR